MSFNDYLNPTYLSNLSISERNSATKLVFYPETDNYSWDNEALYVSEESYAILHDTFSIRLQQGATYNIASASYFDPYILMIYDSNGVPVVANSEANDSSSTTTIGYDNIRDFIAPTTGTYYISASWHQGSYYKTVGLFVAEKINTALVINHAPTITSSSTGNVAENASITTVIYDANATDVDANTTLIYSLSGTDASLLNINSSNGQVTLKTSPDYENKNSYSFNVIASDGNLSDTRSVTVTVTDANETQTQITPTGTNTTAKIFLSSNDQLILSNDGATIYATSGSDVVKLSSNVSAVTLDQNIDRVVLAGSSSEYTYAQGGNQIKIYSGTTNTLLAAMPVQGDSDGTLLTFTDGTANVKLTAGVMTIGSSIVSSAIQAKSPQLDSTLKTSDMGSAGVVSSKVYLGANDQFTANNSGITIYASSGTNDVVTLSSGVGAVTLDQNIDRVVLAGSSSEYTYAQGGNQIKIYNSATNTLIAAMPVQGDSDGTRLTFKNGTADAKLSSGIMSFGGTTISSVASAVTPNIIDATLKSASGNTISVSSSGSVSAAGANYTYSLAAGNYTYSIAGFGAGDVLDFPDSNSASVFNTSYTDGNVNLTFAHSNNTTITVALTGLSIANDAALNSIADFNTLFGAGTIEPSNSNTISVSSSGSVSAAGANYIYTIAAGNYTYSIAGFGAGDVLDFPNKNSASVVNTSFADGSISLNYAHSDYTITTITLTGLSTANDIALTSMSDFATVFGSGTIA